MPLARVLAVGAVPARLLAATRRHGPALRPFELGYVLAEHVAGPQRRDQIVKLALVVLRVAVLAVRLVLLVQGDVVQDALARILALHRPLLQLELKRGLGEFDEVSVKFFVWFCGF